MGRLAGPPWPRARPSRRPDTGTPLDGAEVFDGLHAKPRSQLGHSAGADRSNRRSAQELLPHEPHVPRPLPDLEHRGEGARLPGPTAHLDRRGKGPPGKKRRDEVARRGSNPEGEVHGVGIRPARVDHLPGKVDDGHPSFPGVHDPGGTAHGSRDFRMEPVGPCGMEEKTEPDDSPLFLAQAAVEAERKSAGRSRGRPVDRTASSSQRDERSRQEEPMGPRNQGVGAEAGLEEAASPPRSFLRSRSGSSAPNSSARFHRSAARAPSPRRW